MTDRARPLRAVEEAHTGLGLTFREIARALGADESTLHRWRAAETGPSPVFQVRLEALGELLAALERTFPSQADARAWLDRPLTSGPDSGVPDASTATTAASAAPTPRALLLAGRLERLTARLLSGDACPPS